MANAAHLSYATGLDVLKKSWRDAEYASPQPVRIEVSPGNNKLGFINRAGDVVISPIYDLSQHPYGGTVLEKIQFHDHIALVKRDGIYCYIDHAGKCIARFHGSYCREFSDGLAAVGLLVDATGECVDDIYQP